MDNLILRKLEKLMNKSPISPYATARSVLFVYLLSWVFFNWKGHTTIWFYINLVLLIWIVYIFSHSSYIPERMNRRHYSNTYKQVKKNTRLGLLLSIVIVTIFPDLSPHIRDSFFYFCLTFIIYEYLIAIEWTRPFYGAHRRRYAGAGIMGRIRRSAKLKRN